MTETPILVSLREVGKTFKSGTVALAGVDLDVKQDEFLTLLGPSGCGKSTVLRLIAGLDGATSGRLTRPADLGKHDIGFVFQEPTLLPWASVFDNVWLPLRLQKQSARAAAPAIEEALALVGLSSFAPAYPRELSGGMRMRVSIARALVLRPALLLMDEPFAALDEITRYQLNDDLIRLKRELGMTIVFVTHSVFEGVYLSTRIAIMGARPGRIFAELEIDPTLARNENFRASPFYGICCNQASKALYRAMHTENRQ